MDTLKELLETFAASEDGLTIACRLVSWLRPEHISQIETTESKIEALAHSMAAHPEEADTIRTLTTKYLSGLAFLPLYSKTGILPPRSFFSEAKRRIYDRLMPKPPLTYGARNLIAQMFNQRDDYLWVEEISSGSWLRLFRIFVPESSDHKVEQHLYNECLYALEMLSIWLASEEMNDELLRLDPTTVDRDSNFIAQEREINLLVTQWRAQLSDQGGIEALDTSHAWVMLQQCADQVKNLSQLALRKGSDLKLTYLLERLEQILLRTQTLLTLLEESEQEKRQHHCVMLFKTLVHNLNDENSVNSLIRQTSYLLAKSVTNHASRAGEHYVTHDRKEYLKMFSGGLGAGFFIAMMACIKLYILSLGLSLEQTTLWVCLNYGVGFVIIHMCNFTVATKQPAMTAAYIAEKLEHATNGAVNQTHLAKLMIKVGRSQFAAILGNVVAALPIAVLIGLMAVQYTGVNLVSPSGAEELMQEQNPVTSLALFYAAIAGFWLFVSGIVAGYFDNRCLYLDLPGRIRLHPLSRAFLSANMRDRVANYIEGHYGALWGNFFFGVMLGLTAYLGYWLSIPLDIRHVAFSVSNVGYASVTTWPGTIVFIEFVLFALLIGLVNLTVSFTLALNVAVRSRGLRLGHLGLISKAFWKECISRPQDLFVPPKPDSDAPSSQPSK